MWEHISPVLLLKMKVSVKFVTVSRRDLRYPVLTDYLPFFKSAWPTLGPGCWNCFFIPRNAWKVLSQPGKSGGFVRNLSGSQTPALVMEGRQMPCGTKGQFTLTREKQTCANYKLSHAHTHTEVKAHETLFLSVLILTFPNDCLLSLFTSISATPSLLISSSCCIYNCSLFLFPLHRCVLLRTWKGVLLHVSWLKMNAEYNSVPSPFFFFFFFFFLLQHQYACMLFWWGRNK